MSLFHDLHLQPERVQRVLVKGLAGDIADYITRYELRHCPYRTTLATICGRFRLRIQDARFVIDNDKRLHLTHFIYASTTAEDTWASAMVKAWWPQECVGAAPGRRIVAAVDWGDDDGSD